MFGSSDKEWYGMIAVFMGIGAVIGILLWEFIPWLWSHISISWD